MCVLYFMVTHIMIDGLIDGNKFPSVTLMFVDNKHPVCGESSASTSNVTKILNICVFHLFPYLVPVSTKESIWVCTSSQFLLLSLLSKVAR